MIISLVLALLVLPLVSAECGYWKCEGTVISQDIEMLTDQTGSFIFRDKSDYGCELVDYCKETCFNPEELCKKPTADQIQTDITHTSTKEGGQTTYKAYVSTTFTCDDGTFAGPFLFDKEFTINSCSDKLKARDDARTERDQKCGEDSSEDQSGAEAACAAWKTDIDTAKARLAESQDDLAKTKADLKWQEELLTANEGNLADLKSEYARLKQDEAGAWAVVVEKKAAWDWAKYESTVRWGKAIASSGGFIIGLGIEIGDYIAKVYMGEEIGMDDVAGTAIGTGPDIAEGLGAKLGKNLGLGTAGEALGPLGTAIGAAGELEEAEAKVRAAEAAFWRAVEDWKVPKGYLNAFEVNGLASISKLETQTIPSIKGQIKIDQDHITFLEGTLIPSQESTVKSAEHNYEICLDDYNLAQGKEKDEACEDAEAKLKKAQAAYDECLAALAAK